MKKYWPIIKDALILLTVSTLFVTVCNNVFRGLKKSAATDPVVTAIIQENIAGISETLSEEEFKKDPQGAASFNDYTKMRLNSRDDQKRTPVMWAAYLNVSDTKRVPETDAKRVAIVEILAQKGADLNARDEHGWTPLMWASWSGLTKTTQRMTELGANVTLADIRGNTALMLAAQRANTDIVQFLIARGASRASATIEGKTAKDIAQTALFQYPERSEAYQKILSIL